VNVGGIFHKKINGRDISRESWKKREEGGKGVERRRGQSHRKKKGLELGGKERKSQHTTGRMLHFDGHLRQEKNALRELCLGREGGGWARKYDEIGTVKRIVPDIKITEQQEGHEPKTIR